jgi:alpha-beta hydrolase superfamily lysophospholipase
MGVMLVSNVATSSAAPIAHREFFVESAYDGLQISVLEVVPVEKPKAVVYLAHGLCGCKERFLPFMEYLAANGVACVANDHRGHGNSIRTEADRGYTYQGGAKAMVMDMEVVADYIAQHYQGVPITLLGHSMGSLAARTFLKQNDDRLDKVIICGSPSPNPMAPIGRAIVNIMSKRDSGKRRPEMLQKFTSTSYNRRFKHEGYQAWTCSDAKVRKQFADDPRCNFTITVDLAKALMDLMKETYSKKDWGVKRSELPILFISGEDDPCMISKKRFERVIRKIGDCGYKNVQSITYPQMRHEILNEIDKQKVWVDVLSFIGSAYSDK